LKVVYFILGAQNSEDGVSKKIFNQTSQLIRLGQKVNLIIISYGDINFPFNEFLKIISLKKVSDKDFLGRFIRILIISRIFGTVISSLESDDILYYRFSIPFPLFYPINYMRIFRKCKIVTEHQTIEGSEFKLLKHPLYYASEVLFGRFLKSQSDGIIGVTDEITNYEIKNSGNRLKPHITIGNGIDVDLCPIKLVPPITEYKINLLCVANISRWHGIDRLIHGIHQYHGKYLIMLHIAGKGNEMPFLVDLVDKLNIKAQIIFHGFKTSKELNGLYNTCHIAVGSLGIHRKGLSMTSELKAREYCARGIPYIIACRDPDFPDNFPYILRIDPNDSPIEIEAVINFVLKVCSDPNHPTKMHTYAEQYLDWTAKMIIVKEFLETLGKG
jgi:glycosyltransferase involved in cell wall biosynthesis